MKLGIMQPYFFPYIGYFQLINVVDTFVIYDNIEFSKRGWFRRNRILVNGQDTWISLPIKHDSDYLNVNERFLAENYQEKKMKLLRTIENAYIKAPYFKDIFPIIERSLNFENDNLFDFLYHSIITIINYLEINTNIMISSKVNIDHSKKGVDKVLALIEKLGADVYINPIGGKELYKRNNFLQKDIELKFIKTKDIKYKQFDNKFVPFLSIIDVMMFNSKEKINEMLTQYNLE